MDKVFALGLDLGRTAESSGLAVVEAVKFSHYSPSNCYLETQEFHVRDLHSFCPGEGYSEIIKYVLKVLDKVELSFFVVDQTAVGEPIVKMIEKEVGKRLRAVVIGGQHIEHYSNGLDYIPKQTLVSDLMVLLIGHRLKISKDLPEAKHLTQELLNYENRPTSGDSLKGDTWREQPSDDLIFATALACWKLQKPPDFQYDFL